MVSDTFIKSQSLLSSPGEKGEEFYAEYDLQSTEICSRGRFVMIWFIFSSVVSFRVRCDCSIR